jgi:hypothetical protein
MWEKGTLSKHFMIISKNLLLVIVFIVSCTFNNFIFAQADQSLNVFGYKLLNYQDNYLPDNLLSSRTAVFVSTLPKPNGTRGDWRALSEKAHEYLKKIEIDPVAYFHNEDIFSGVEPARNFINWIQHRKIENLIFLSERMVNGQKEFLIIVTPFNGTTELADQGQPAWKLQHTDLERLFVVLYRLSAGKNLKKENLLIVDRPEFFTDIPMLIGKRFEAYQQDLKLDKLAVPIFREIAVPSQYPDHPLNHEIAREANRYNARVDELNLRLEQLMTHYPFSYGLVDLSKKTPEQLRNEGFQFILYHINTTGKNIKNLLDYNVEETETAFVSLVANNSGTSIKPIPVDSSVYKYYVKHILTNDVFLGSKWDADTDWGQALLNHLTNMKIELKIK